MTAGRLIDFGVARARLRGEGWSALEAELVEVPDPEPIAVSSLLAQRAASDDPRVCQVCGVGGGAHAADCSHANLPAWRAPVLTLAPPPAPLQLTLDEEGA